LPWQRNVSKKLAISRLILSPRSWRLSVCNKCARGTLDWSQSKIFLVKLNFAVMHLTLESKTGHIGRKSPQNRKRKFAKTFAGGDIVFSIYTVFWHATVGEPGRAGPGLKWLDQGPCHTLHLEHRHCSYELASYLRRRMYSYRPCDSVAVV